MNNIIVRINGGLGNQMFQFAYAYLLCIGQKNTEILLDTREFNKYYWPYGLSDFVLVDNCKTISQRQRYDFAINVYRLKRHLAYVFSHKKLNYLDKHYLKKGFLFCGTFCELPKPEQIEQWDDLLLFGYFQNAELFSRIRGDLFEAFQLKNKTQITELYLSQIREKSVSISIRIAEQVEIEKGERFAYSAREYYYSLLEIIEKKRGYKPQLVISSNDIDTIISENWFSNYDVLYIKDCSATEQIEILKQCHDFILSNSTFSWWAAYLGSYGKDSIVLAPRIWYQDTRIEDTKLLFDGMEVIDF